MNWHAFVEIFTGHKKHIDNGPYSMRFHLYNSNRRLRGTCGFEYLGDVSGPKEKLHVYAVAITKVDKVDLPVATKREGHGNVEARLHELVQYYRDHVSDFSFHGGSVVWKDNKSCIIALPKMMPSATAREVIASTVKGNNSIGSFMPRFISRAKTRRELN